MSPDGPASMRDACLTAVSIAAIVLACWPAGDPRQIVSIDDPGASSFFPRRFALPLDDPRLAEIKTRLSGWGPREPVGQLAVARWRLDSARHYAAQDARAESRTKSSVTGGTMIQASFRGDSTGQGSGEATSVARKSAVGSSEGARFWRDRAAAAEQSIARLREDWQRARQDSAPPPIALGPVFRPAPTGTAYSAAAIASVVGLLFGWLLSRRSRPVRLAVADAADGGWSVRDDESADPARSASHAFSETTVEGWAQNDAVDWQSRRLMAMRWRASWVRVRQPLRVQLRRLVLGSLTVAAVATQFA